MHTEACIVQSNLLHIKLETGVLTVLIVDTLSIKFDHLLVVSGNLDNEKYINPSTNLTFVLLNSVYPQKILKNPFIR